MAYYETLLLARTEITKDEIANLEQQLDKLISGAKGKLGLFDKWGKYKLSYPVQKNLYGIYLLTRYELPNKDVAEVFKELNMLFKIKYNDLIMRFVTTKLEGTPSTTYKKPESIDSRGTSSLDSFIKEHKMEGFIDNVDVSKKKAVQTPAEETPAKEVLPTETTTDETAEETTSETTESNE